LKRTVADLTLDKLILKEAAEGNFRALLVAASVWSTFDRYWMFLNAKPAEFSDSQEQPSVLSVSAPRYHIRYHTLIRFHGVLRGFKEHREGLIPSRFPVWLQFGGRWGTRTSDPLLVSYVTTVSHCLRLTTVLSLMATWTVYKCLRSSQTVCLRP
jgi:hypothetical protein